MKVSKTTTSKSETSASIDLFDGRKLSPSAKKQIQEEVGVYLVEQSLIEIADSKSPVKGEAIPGLKKGPYRDKKKEELGTTRADLQFSGNTLDQLTYRATKDGIKIGVFGSDAPILDGHSNLSGKSTLPRRRIVPGVGQEYRSPITKEVERIVADAVASETNFKKSDFKAVQSKADLYSVLKKHFGDMTRNEISLAVYRSDDLLDLLSELELLKLL